MDGRNSRSLNGNQQKKIRRNGKQRLKRKMVGRVFGIRMALRFVQSFSREGTLLDYPVSHDLFAILSFLPPSEVQC